MAANIAPSPAHKFDLRGWEPDQGLSDDENYMDAVMLITRGARDGATGRQGHMGAVLVRPSSRRTEDPGDGGDCEEVVVVEEEEPRETHRERILSNLLGAATNVALFSGSDRTSDVHAEISALAEASRSCRPCVGCTMYITIPPCKRCFAAMVVFGVKRIVTRLQSPAHIVETAASRDMDVEAIDRETNRRQMRRMNLILNADRPHKELMEIADRTNRDRRMRRRLDARGGDGVGGEKASTP